MSSLMGMSRAQFVQNLDDSLDWLGTPAAITYASVLPPWAQSGPWGWPLPFFNEMLFGAGKMGIETVLIPLLNPLEGAVEQVAEWITNLGSWLTSREGNCESADDFADAIEEWAAETQWAGPVWEAA